MKVRKVFKYGTGQPIPEGASYLSTQVERRTVNYNDVIHGNITDEKNVFVWHYFLVEIEEGEE